MSSQQPKKPYVPPPSIGHEIGVIFGFIAFMLLCMITYGFVWQVGNKRSQLKEAKRIEALRASGLLGKKGVGEPERREKA